MNANELRIGNFFKDEKGIILTCLGITSETNENGGIVWYDNDLGFYLQLSECLPIPLTEDWLLKFGFKRNDELSAAVSSYEFPTPMGLFFLSSTTSMVTNITWYNLSFPSNDGACYLPAYNQCQYVHQLQNLIFALTGKELPI